MHPQTVAPDQDLPPAPAVAPVLDQEALAPVVPAVVPAQHLVVEAVEGTTNMTKGEG